MSDGALVAYIGLGANVGACEEAFRIAEALLPGEVGARSTIFRTAPVGPAQPDFLNAAVRLETGLSPQALLERLLEIERKLGRDRTRETRWGPRTLDLDILWIDGRVLREAELIVPHPRLRERAFALAPLVEIMPDDHASRPDLARALTALGPRPDAARLLEEVPSDPPGAGGTPGDRRRRSVFATRRLDAVAAALRAPDALEISPRPAPTLAITARDLEADPDAWLAELCARHGAEAPSALHLEMQGDELLARVFPSDAKSPWHMTRLRLERAPGGYIATADHARGLRDPS